MMIPLHLIPAQSRSSLEFFDDGVAEVQDLGLSIAGPVDGVQLQAFQSLMQQAGLRLQPTRMLYDRLYAFERLAEAHASGNQALRELAMQLFDSYQRAGEWIALMH
ncbi:hypothetical protein OOZ63_12910 [Paucibacter sp. PLA-PC-4]|uniref:hypothetical protein n=1 Tax=Paucibacter sp. PLA-PC-4 TaxID=2993655 RepID=UPI002248CDFE|nr:hypothetical protein [Paucibacter sp. PLA-PC-4]MCX2862737.1 hypothetical protein [Paucibacter sp. PLA-PC-4]